MKNFKNLHPVDYLRIIWRRRWFALAAFVLVSGAVGTYAWFMPDVYRSESRILVESAAIAQDYVRPSIRSTPEEQIAAIRSQVQSRSFMEKMIQENALFGYGTEPKFSMDKTVAALNRNVQILNISRNTFSISFSANDPQLAQNFTKSMVDTLRQSGSTTRKTRAVETDQFLDEQLRKAKDDLASHEEKIKQFKTIHLGQLPEQSMANMNALNGSNTQLAAVENALQQARERQKLHDLRVQERKRLSMLAQSVLIPATPPPDPAPSIETPVNPKLEAKLAELATLTSRYTSNHPDVVRVAKEVEDLKKQSAEASSELTEVTPAVEPEKSAGPELAGISVPEANEMEDFEDATIKFEADSIKGEIAKREREKEAILGQIKAYQARLNLAPAIEQELMSLSREHEILKQQYSNLQDKKWQAQMTANMETSTSGDAYKVIDEANLPERPAFPNRQQIVFIGLCAGLVLGIGAAFGREILDTTMVSEEEAAAVLKLPVLASISEIPRKGPKQLAGFGGMPKSA